MGRHEPIRYGGEEPAAPTRRSDADLTIQRLAERRQTFAARSTTTPIGPAETPAILTALDARPPASFPCPEEGFHPAKSSAGAQARVRATPGM